MEIIILEPDRQPQNNQEPTGEPRTRKRSSLNNNEDRISTLPNVLLHHILSFVDAVQVVQTCVLSKRWMNVWKSHPYLDFNFETFSSLINSDYYDDESLKTLHLGGARNFDGKIFSTCPNLENLKIEDIYLNTIENFNIHALNLKSLEILNWRYGRIMRGCKVMLFAPKLTSFKFYGNTPLFWSEVNLTSLDDVNVVLQRYHHSHNYPFYVVEDEYISEEDETEQGLGLNLIKMLHQFCSAKSLTLSMNIIEILSEVPAALDKHPSPFSNLKYLKLKTDHKDVTLPAHVLNYFLRSSSFLKVSF